MTAVEDFSGIPRFDINEALRRCMGKRDFLEELSVVFVEDSLPLYFPALKQGIKDKDFEIIAKNSHGIKGGCGAIGLIRARDMAYIIEMAAKSGDIQKIEQVLPLLVAELDQVVEVITTGTVTDMEEQQEDI
ncbi:MAG: Hpt domain-containing protein [Desulfonatronovibrio sp.]